MDKSYLQTVQDEAQQAYERTNGLEAFTAAQAMFLAEIAEQLRKQNHWLEQIAHTLKSLDDNSIVTQRP